MTVIDDEGPLPEPVPAATLIAMRARPEGPPEVLMIERAAGMAFAGGAWVFPGGRVDPADAVAAGEAADAQTIGKVAAIRETIEEAGLAIGLDPLPPPATLAAMRAGFAAGRPLGGLLAEAGCRLDLDALVPFARWIPPGGRVRRFDTRFYLACVTEEAEIEADGGESVALRWTTAADALAAAAAGTMSVIFPTHCNLVPPGGLCLVRRGGRRGGGGARAPADHLSAGSGRPYPACACRKASAIPRSRRRSAR